MLTARRQRGFNLTEAMITLSVLGVLIAAAVPSMTDWIRGTRVRALAESMQNGLQKARAEAMRRNVPVTYWMVTRTDTPVPDDTCALAADSGAWVVSLDDPAKKCGAAPSATVAPRIVDKYSPGPTDLVIQGRTSDDKAATSVTFNGFGQTTRAAGDLARIDISHADSTVRRLRIEISASGGVRLCDREVAAPDLRACTP